MCKIIVCNTGGFHCLGIAEASHELQAGAAGGILLANQRTKTPTQLSSVPLLPNVPDTEWQTQIAAVGGNSTGNAIGLQTHAPSPPLNEANVRGTPKLSDDVSSQPTSTEALMLAGTKSDHPDGADEESYIHVAVDKGASEVRTEL